jgi:hypothetical protein
MVPLKPRLVRGGALCRRCRRVLRHQRLIRPGYNFSRIDNIALGLHDGRMKRLSIPEVLFILRCPSWRMRAAMCLWVIGLSRQARRLIE